jgi:hypothetical protein
MKDKVMNHPFFGEIEIASDNFDYVMPSYMIEGIELLVFVIVTYFVFFKFSDKKGIKYKKKEQLKKDLNSDANDVNNESIKKAI